MNTEKTNIIYVICHDIGKHIGCYGAMVESPNLDAFAEDGTKFTNAFCNSPCCSPSRMCAMTGKYAHVTGGIGLTHMGWPLPESEKTVVDYLNDAGYETVHCGFSHERGPGLNHYKIDHQHTMEDCFSENAISKAIEYLESHKDSDVPFYLNIGTSEVHVSLWNWIKNERYGKPVAEEDVYVPNYIPDTPPLRRALGRFQAAIRHLDIHFQRLIEAIDRLGYNQNTVVVFTTDHGISNYRSKSTLYDRGCETALMMRVPHGKMSGKVIDELIPNIDLAPTILELAGVTAPEDMNGRSFLSLLTGNSYTPNKEIYLERNFHGEYREYGVDEFIDKYDPVRSVRTKDFHYIKYFAPDTKKQPLAAHEINKKDFENVVETPNFHFLWPESQVLRQDEQLFHIPHDPGEFFDLAYKPEYAAIKKELEEKVQRWMEETDDHILRNVVPQNHQKTEKI